ncbi:MAG: ribosome-associated translation inhibitor RaiA [Dehalococcoidales bacterium]|nr:ribosome-associated translation inhibitor RaiA [Dehalococcoidales bacterium]
MELQITGQSIEILPTVKDYIEKKFGKLDRHFQNINGTKVELSEQKTKSQDQRYRVQVTLDANGTLLRAEERAENLLVAIDKVLPVIDRQIERYKGKLNKKGKAGPSIRNTNNGEPAVDDSSNPTLVRTKRFTMKPMSVEDAIEQMELLGHDFFLFHNSATKEFNLLYRRKDGNYSIIEPELE